MGRRKKRDIPVVHYRYGEKEGGQEEVGEEEEDGEAGTSSCISISPTSMHPESRNKEILTHAKPLCLKSGCSAYSADSKEGEEDLSGQPRPLDQERDTDGMSHGLFMRRAHSDEVNPHMRLGQCRLHLYELEFSAAAACVFVVLHGVWCTSRGREGE